MLMEHYIQIEHFYSGTDGNWVIIEYDKITVILNFVKIKFQISLKNIYNKVDFEYIKNYSLHR